jgi:hypothetical protein
VRLALSAAAAKTLSEPRVRRLLELELGDTAVLAPASTGPLGDHVAYIWVDQSDPSQVSIEVRVGDRPVDRRDIAVAGLKGDVAARLVTIAGSEMVRAQMQPAPAKRAPPPRKPTPEEAEVAVRTQPALQLSAAAAAAFLPPSGGALAGPSLGIAFRDFGVGETLFARWLTGAAEGSSARWLEAGLAVDYRLWLSPRWRLTLGGLFAASSLHIPDALSVDGAAGQRDTWSARAGALVGVETRVVAPLWLGLLAEPGAILRPAPFEDAAGAQRSVSGAWLGLDLALTVDLHPGAPAR